MATTTMNKIENLSLDADEKEAILTLTSSDNHKFEISQKAGSLSKLIKNSIEGENVDLSVNIPIPNVEGAILKLVVDFLKYHDGEYTHVIEKPLKSKNMKEVCEDEWDANFIDNVGEDRKTLYDLIMAANYMDIHGLLHLGGAKVASFIKGEPLENIKNVLALEQPPAETIEV